MSKNISNVELIQLAAKVLNPVEVDGDWHGDVGSALLTEDGNVHTGVCVHAGSDIGFCAERLQ